MLIHHFLKPKFHLLQQFSVVHFDHVGNSHHCTITSNVTQNVPMWCYKATVFHQMTRMYKNSSYSLCIITLYSTHDTKQNNLINRLTSVSGVISSSRGLTIPALITKSLRSGPSPAIFPNAQTACSATLECSDRNSFTNDATAPEAEN